MPRYYLLIVFVLNIGFCFGQNSIEGNVKNNLGKPLIGATVIVRIQNSSTVISYDVTDFEGKFSIVLGSNSTNLVVSATYLGYKISSKTIDNKTQTINLVLEESPEELKEVLIESKTIEKKGDTLSYSVSAFKDQKDRSIADVIKKMPGIEVLPNGLILYMGQPIEKYYIEGMDMLEGRYNLANDNISADDVSKVQVLENHQPLKVLDSLVFSDRTSLNIKLKKDISITGNAEVGAGLSPILFKTNITPLIFTKKSQALFSYQYNNTGNNLARNTSDFSTSDNVVSGFSPSKNSLMSINQLSRPPFATARWLDNSDHFGNIDYLFRLKNKTVLKVNLSYLNGTHIDRGTKNTTYITDNGAINYREEAKNIKFLSSLNSKFTLERNLDLSYLRNTLAVKTFWDCERSILVNENQNVLQELSNPYFELTNKFKLIKPIGKQLITFNSNTGFTTSDQELNVFPGQFAETLNDDQDYQSNKQLTGLTTFFTENTAGMTKKLGAFTFSPEVGFAYKNQKLTTDLLKAFDGNQSNIGTAYQNNLRLTNSNIFFTNQTNFKQNNWRIVLQSPLYLRYFRTENRISNIQQTIRKLNFEPDLSITKKLSPYWEVNVSGHIVNKFGEIDNLFDGYLLKNYLSLIRYNSTLEESTSYSSSLNIRYRDALKAIFAGLSFSYNKNNSNLLFNNSIAEDGSLIIESVERDNEIKTRNVDFNGSKYFNKIKTTLTVGAGFSFSERPQIVNAALGSYRSTSQRYNLDIESEITTWFSLSGSTRLSNSKLSSPKNQSNRIKNWENSIKTFFYLNDHELFNISAEHYYNSIGTNTNNNYFINLSYQFTFKKYNLDAKLVYNNVLNTSSYVNVFNDQFFTIENYYQLRPSQLLMSFKFTL